MSKRLGTSVAWALLATVWMGPAIALEAPVVGDSYVKPKGSTAVFGTRAAMVVNQSNDTYVQFDTSGVSEPFERAEMRIQLKVLRRAGDLSLHRLLGPWTETTLNSKNVPDSDPTGTTAQLADEADVFVADITDLVQSWIDDPSSNHGLVIQSSGGRAVFWSRNSAKPPTLSLTDSGGDVSGGAPKKQHPPRATTVCPSKNSPPGSVTSFRTMAAARTSPDPVRSPLLKC